jgi:hypothetical protein
VAFADSIIVRLENEDTEVKYQIPRLEIATLIDDKIMLRSKQSEIDQKYRTSSIQKSPIWPLHYKTPLSKYRYRIDSIILVCDTALVGMWAEMFDLQALGYNKNSLINTVSTLTKVEMAEQAWLWHSSVELKGL